MTEIWNAFIVGPLEGALTGLYGILGSFGLAIIVLTVAIKLITFPLNMMQIRSSKAMRDVQPLMDEVKRKYAKDKEKQTQETMRIYKEHGVNPAAGCLPMLIQMPVWFGLYWALIALSQDASSGFRQGFLYLPSLAEPDHTYIMVVLTVVTQFIVQKMMTMPSTDPQQQTMNRVMLFMPLTFGFVATTVPSGLALYWVTTNIFTFFQQLLTTGWGGLLPKKSAAAAASTSRQQLSNSSQAAALATSEAASGDESGDGSGARVPKAAKHKKKAGAKPLREEKRANGKR